MPSRDILNSHSVTALKKEIAKTNIKGYSKMKKSEVVSLMLKHKDRFHHIKHKEKVKKLAKKPRKEEPKKKEPRKEEPIKTNFKFNPSKLTIREETNLSGNKFYDIFYRDNNARIDGLIPPKKPPYFYLKIYAARDDKSKPRAAKGEANFYLCEVIKSLLKNNKLNLTRNSDFKLTAGNISDGHNQSKLNKYYESLGFRKDGTPTSSGNQDFKQSISSFMKNCEKFR